jgi:hypothetical protein
VPNQRRPYFFESAFKHRNDVTVDQALQGYEVIKGGGKTLVIPPHEVEKFYEEEFTGPLKTPWLESVANKRDRDHTKEAIRAWQDNELSTGLDHIGIAARLRDLTHAVTVLGESNPVRLYRGEAIGAERSLEHPYAFSTDKNIAMQHARVHETWAGKGTAKVTSVAPNSVRGINLEQFGGYNMRTPRSFDRKTGRRRLENEWLIAPESIQE